jgi:cytochrome P450
MANVDALPRTLPAATANEAPEVKVDPALLAVIKSAGAPRGMPKLPRPSSEIPGTLGLFEGFASVIGNLRRGVAYSNLAREKFGDVYRAPFPGLPMVVVWDADEIYRIFKNDDRVWSAAMGWDTLMFGALDKRSGNVGTLLSFDFDDHKVARKVVQPAFTLKAIEGYLSVADRGFSETVPAWVARGHVDFKREVRTLLARVAGEIFTGIRDPKKVAVVDRALSDFWHGMMALTQNPWVSPAFRKARKGLATLIETFLALVPERQKTGGNDLFSKMCEDIGTEGFGEEAIVRIFISIMFGAFDTTSAGLTSMAYLLAKHPDWQERLRDEARAVGPDAPDVAAMRGMKHHEWVWKETLRLMPVNGLLPRRALVDVEVGGYKLKAGTFVAPMNGSIGRHPKWWTEPNTFDPARFSPERAEDKKHPGIYNPFGAGAHACVGMQLANMEMKVFWHRVLTTCRFRLTRDYEAHHTHTPMGMVSGDVALTLEPLRAEA